MQLLRFNKKQKLEAQKMHRKCREKERERLKKKQHVDRIENGIYRIAR